MPNLKGATPKPEPTCYVLETHMQGITFEMPGNTHLFALESFLSYVRMQDAQEITFHYTYGVVRIRGHHLEAIYQLAKKRHLGIVRLSEANDPCRAEIEIRGIVFEDSSSDVN